MKKILYITFFDPRYVFSGTQQRTHRLWHKLKKEGDVFTLILVSEKVATKIIDEQKRIAYIGIVSTNFFIRAFHWLFMPARIFGENARFANLNPWKHHKFDMIVTRYLDSAAIINTWDIPVRVDVDDLPTEAMRTIWSKRWPFFMRWLPKFVVEKWEHKILRKCSFAYVSNKNNKKYVSQFCKSEVFLNEPMPLGDNYCVKGNQEKAILSVGTMDYPPNVEGVKWFVENVWREIRKKFPDMIYRIIGRGLSGEESFLLEDGVEYLGYVEDLDKEYEKVLAVVAPIFSGAGTCIKVLEACSRKRKVFATHCAVRGLDSEIIELNKISIVNTKEEMINEMTESLYTIIMETFSI